MSLLTVRDAADLAALLERPVEDWMVYLHPVQLRAVNLSVDGPVRVRGGAGTGKTVVGLHRARRLAEETGGPVLLTTFVNTLPRVWEGLFEAFAPEVQGRIEMRTVDSLALGIYKEGGGPCEPVAPGHRSTLVRNLHAAAACRLAGLSSYGLEEEFDYVLSGRAITSLEDYLTRPRTGRGSALPAPARKVVWELYSAYRDALVAEGFLAWEELRREALRMLLDGEVERSYSAVVVDEAQDLTETSIRLLIELAGGLPSPRLTIVGDGQQSIYPGGFSLRSLGVDVRGRSTVLRTNWRNTWTIWTAAQAFIAGEEFDDLEDDDMALRDETESPYPLRKGREARLHVVEGGEAGEAQWLAELVAEDIGGGVNPGDCAVVHPFNKGVAKLESALKAAGVPVEPLTRYEGRHRSVVWTGTFHRVKGLEFKRVYVAGLAMGRWPLVPRDLDPVAKEQHRARQVRVAFVAMTRARDSLDVVVGGKPAPELRAGPLGVRGMTARVSLFSIGHSNHPLERFLELLRLHAVEAVADVRSSPYSRYAPHFNARNFEGALAAVGVHYVFLGEELGGRPAEDEFYDDEGHVLYGRLAASDFFAAGIARLVDEATHSRVAMVCSEENPTDCLRRLLVARVLAGRGVEALHIRGDGRLETEDEIARREDTDRQESLFPDAKEKA